ncbi:hypothetical protein RJ639_009326 [Escallonia herrerae]|uniref:Reverse transcriptase Ty1/copia-type domain-containing protein n=1 Tax=Escallonia herrerae TaxID=1293975 RepID=A0AA88VTH7_9ASTE|nr:hypothetical protein RJ639_009326 [Escallonia herrerae]
MKPDINVLGPLMEHLIFGLMYGTLAIARLMDGSHIYLLLYIDDMLIAAKSMSDVNSLKEQLKREFEIKDLGVAKRILGMEIQRDRPAGILYLSQKKYIERVLQRFGMKNSKPMTTPLAARFKLSAADSPQT